MLAIFCIFETATPVAGHLSVNARWWFGLFYLYFIFSADRVERVCGCTSSIRVCATGAIHAQSCMCSSN